MRIEPSQVEHRGPGVEIVELPDGLAIRLADPVRDLHYARNEVTLIFDLSAFEHVRLAFTAKEFGDEPHASPPAPFGDDAVFDGVAVSADGLAWYEVQDLRHLRADRFITYDLDLDAAVTARGLAYGEAFRIRFCQYDNNPAPMDGLFLRGIVVSGEIGPFLHLKMDDNALNPVIYDAAAGQHHQTLSAPGGDPNTAAHSVPGPVGSAIQLAKADTITLGNVVDPLLAAGRDFTFCFWWKSEGAGSPTNEHILSSYLAASNHLFWFAYQGNLTGRVCRSIGNFSAAWVGGDDALWHHYALTRQGTTLRFWRDGRLGNSNTAAANAESLVGASLRIGAAPSGGSATWASGCVDDFRVYDRALRDWKIAALAGGPIEEHD